MLRFADSPATMQDEDTQVIKTSRFNLFRESAAIPIATEAIRPGYTTTMQVSLDKQFAHTNMPELKKECMPFGACSGNSRMTPL